MSKLKLKPHRSRSPPRSPITHSTPLTRSYIQTAGHRPSPQIWFLQLIFYELKAAGGEITYSTKAAPVVAGPRGNDGAFFLSPRALWRGMINGRTQAYCLHNNFNTSLIGFRPEVYSYLVH